ncbi:hypothetical protein MD484_g5098, partial [Candolleomyces efflorescens]
MGLTGTGKSTLINNFLREKVMPVGHGLNSCTQEIQCASITLPEDHPIWPNRRVVLVDSPGFDDSERGEFEILRKIAVWLASAYGEQTTIAGLVYLHDISKVRLGGIGLLSYELFHRICGPNALNRVVMATTHWSEIPSKHPEVGQIREQELQQEFWVEALTNGARYRRVSEAPEADNWGIIDHLLAKHFEAVATKIQEELVQRGLRVAQTEAGRTLKDAMHKRLGAPAPEVRPTREELRASSSQRGDNHGVYLFQFLVASWGTN